MKKVNKDILKEAANNLLFDMSDEQYDTLLKEFDILSDQMKFISEVDGIDNVEPMVFPYEVYSDEMREDEVHEVLDKIEALKNAHEVDNGMIRLPKVVK